MALVGGLFFLSLLSPTVRQLFLTVGYLLLGLFALALAFGAGFLIFRLLKRHRQEPRPKALRVFDLNRIEPQVISSRPNYAAIPAGFLELCTPGAFTIFIISSICLLRNEAEDLIMLDKDPYSIFCWGSSASGPRVCLSSLPSMIE